MKRHLPLFLLIIGCCLINCILFGQDNIGKVYSIKFPVYKSRLSKEAKTILNDVAKTMKDQPGSHFAVTGYCSATENRRLNQASWDRANKIITYFVEKLGINADRLIFKYGSDSEDCNKIDIVFTDEIPNTDPPPHPNLRKKLTTTKITSN
jgi:hypothetical protein